MPKFTTFDEEVPLLRDQPVSSGAEGFEAIGKVFGMAGEAFAKKAGDLGEEQSNAMMLQTQAHTDTIKTNAQIEMVKNPGMADKVVQRAAEDYESITNEAMVNNADRQKLKYLAAKDFNDLRLAGAKVEVDSAKKKAQVGFFSSWPQVLQGIKDSANDEKAFNTRVDMAKQSIDSLLIAGTITPKQASAFYQTVGSVVSNVHEFYKRYSAGDTTAKEHNRQLARTTYVDNDNHVNAPPDQGTAHLAATNVQDATVQGVKADADQGKRPNAIAFASIHSPEKLGEVSAHIDGASSADADFYLTNVPFPELKTELKTLENTTTLSHWQQGRKNRLQNIMTHLNNGEYYRLLSKYPMYQGAIGDYNHTISAIGSDKNMSQDQQHQEVQIADNKLAYTAVAIGEAQHIPDAVIHPIPFKWISNGQRSFDSGGDPQLLKTNIGYFNPTLREYYARGMETPVQQETARAIGQLQGARVFDSSLNTLIIANQKGRDFSKIELDKKVISETLFKHIANTSDFIGKQPNGGKRNAAMLQMGENYIKQQALDHGDFGVKNLRQYAEEAATMINKAYPVTRGVNWEMNANDFQNLSKPQMDNISKYLIDYSYEKVLGLDVNNLSMSSKMDRVNLHVVGSANGSFIVQDGQGNQVMTQRYNTNLLAAANHHVESKAAKSLARSKSINLRELHD